MRGLWSSDGDGRATRRFFALAMIMAMLATTVVSVSLLGDTAEARGPAYPGPQTQPTGPAFFGPAPNAFPYCDSPTYFDPFVENETPIGRMSIGDTASVTTDGLTMDLVITDVGSEADQYPGFFPANGEGSPGDQPKGIELAQGDTAVVTLSQPLFYSQWIFTDVDQPQEGFTITPAWTEVGEAAVFGGDDQWTFAGTDQNQVLLDDLNGTGHPSESILGRVQVDFLGAVTGLEMERRFPSNGQSGFAVGGGCEAAGTAKRLVAGPTWNGTSFDVTYELVLGNNLPSGATLQEVITAAQAGTNDSLVTGPVQGIDLTNLQLTDDLSDAAFSDIAVTGVVASGNLVANPAYDGLTDINLLSSGSIAAESTESITLDVAYTPDPTNPIWQTECQALYGITNQSEISGTAAGVSFEDVSDNGDNPAPSDNNGEGGVDDPTPVNFPCPPGDLQIVKTVLSGPNATCPDFASGTVGDGDPLAVTETETVTYCVSVFNGGPGPLAGVTISDPQAPDGSFAVGDLAAGEEAAWSYDVVVSTATPALNTATASGSDVNGPVPDVSDTALIDVGVRAQPLLEIVKTVVAGANATCPTPGVSGIGPALSVDDGDDVGTLAGNGGTVTLSYTLTVSETTPEVNVATANYEGPEGPLPAVDDNAQIDVQPLQPGLDIVKTVLEGPGGTCPDFAGGVQGAGDALQVNDREVVTYCITVTNTGPGIATDVVVTDPQAPDTPYAVGTLAAGAEFTISYDVTVALTTPLVNVATANGDGPDGALPQVEDPAVIEIEALPDPDLQIVKTALAGADATCPDFAGGVVGLGTAVSLLDTDTVTYCVTVINQGSGPASNVVIADDQAPAGSFTIGDLAPGEEQTRQYNVVVSTLTPTVNTATANGTGLNGQLPEVADPAQITVGLQPDPDCPTTFDEAGLGDGDPLVITFGNTITYCVVVTNVGGNPATDVVVTDSQAPGPIPLGTVAVGDVVVESYDVVVDATTPLQNTATVDGNGPNGPLAPRDDTAVITPGDPVLEIVKTVVQGPDGACPTTFDDGVVGEGAPLALLFGDVATYCVAVRNTGLNDATNVVVTDPQAGGPLAIGPVVAAGTTSFDSYDVLVDADTPLLNVVTANGSGPNGPLPPIEDPAIIDTSPQPNPVLQIGPTTFDEAGLGDGDPLVISFSDTVTYCVAVRNVGLRPATDVVVSDAQAPGDIELGSLDVNETKFGSYDVVVGANTPPRNTARVDGNGPNGPLTPDSDTAIITPGDPALEIVKTVVPGPNGVCPVTFDDGIIGDGPPLVALFDDVVTYCIAVRNTGDNDATNVVVVDGQAPGPLQVGTLAVGEAYLDSYDVTVDANTPELNTATASGSGPNGDLPDVADTALIGPAPQPDPVCQDRAAGSRSDLPSIRRWRCRCRRTARPAL